MHIQPKYHNASNSREICLSLLYGNDFTSFVFFTCLGL